MCVFLYFIIYLSIYFYVRRYDCSGATRISFRRGQSSGSGPLQTQSGPLKARTAPSKPERALQVQVQVQVQCIYGHFQMLAYYLVRVRVHTVT